MGMINKTRIALGSVLLVTAFVASCSLPKRIIYAPSPDKARISKLSKRIDEILQDTLLLGATTGIKVISLRANKVLYKHNADKLFNPASNMKLITSAAALVKLGPEYKFKTVVYADTNIKNGKVLGNIYIKGYGDPDLKTVDLLEMAKDIKWKGTKEITGDLIVDDFFFDSIRKGRGWMWDYGPYVYNARIGALSLNENSIMISVKPGDKAGAPVNVRLEPPTKYVDIDNQGIAEKGWFRSNLDIDRVMCDDRDVVVIAGTLSINSTGITVFRNLENPPIYTATVFKELLEKEGIKIDGDIKIDTVPIDVVEELVTHYSEPLTKIIYYMNKVSSNFVAEQLLKTLGTVFEGEPGTADKGMSVVTDFMSQIGVHPGKYRATDGSGLSRYDLLSPSQIIKLLIFMYDDFEYGPEYLTSLPVAGIDGTLRRRMREPSIQRKMRAKTGTLSGVSCLSGYVPTRDGDILVFAMMMNNFLGNVNNIRRLQDRIGEALVDF